ncbi:MAG: hypothetical protein V4757_20380 [Pseudomonadota bacterium]
MPNRKSLPSRLLNATLVPLVALVLIFEEWGWEPLSRFLGRMARLPLWGLIERLIVRLPPYAALLAFALPAIVLFPVKLLALYWLSQGHAFLGIAVIAAAKVLGTAIVARLFTLTHPTLMQLPWFAALYLRWKAWKDAVIAHVKATRQWRLLTVLKRRLAKRTRRWMMLMRQSFRPS